MTTYIAVYKATHRIIQIEEHACFTWQQESGDIDMEMLSGKIKRERSIHFFNLVVTTDYPMELDDIKVVIEKSEVFRG
tara:strand:+ start:1884 stop:2117 length:234 start_codon:yes stop_codon:yes gene_type:complete